MSRRQVLLILIFAVILYTVLLFVPAEDHITTGVVHYPISGITIMPGDGHLVSDDTDDPIVEVTEFDFTMQSWVSLILYEIINLPVLPVWPTEILGLIIRALTGIIGLVTSGYLLFFYTRRRLSNNPKSRTMQILSYLKEHPGVSETDIVNATGFSRGSVSYNLRKLLEDGRVSKISSRYYPYDASPSETEAKAEKVLGNKRRQRIFKIILENPGISQKQLSDEMQMPLSTLRWHLGKLEDANLILIEAKQHMTCYSVNNVFSSEEE